MKSRAVLALYYRSFAADGLYRVEAAVPDTDTGERECTHERSSHRYEHRTAYYISDKTGDHSSHRQHFPVALEYEHSEQLARIYKSLFYTSGMLFFHYASPPDAAVRSCALNLLTNSSALPSPPSSF